MDAGHIAYSGCASFDYNLTGIAQAPANKECQLKNRKSAKQIQALRID
jgi:hypothetical protein